MKFLFRKTEEQPRRKGAKRMDLTEANEENEGKGENPKLIIPVISQDRSSFPSFASVGISVRATAGPSPQAARKSPRNAPFPLICLYRCSSVDILICWRLRRAAISCGHSTAAGASWGWYIGAFL